MDQPRAVSATGMTRAVDATETIRVSAVTHAASATGRAASSGAPRATVPRAVRAATTMTPGTRRVAAASRVTPVTAAIPVAGAMTATIAVDDGTTTIVTVVAGRIVAGSSGTTAITVPTASRGVAMSARIVIVRVAGAVMTPPMPVASAAAAIGRPAPARAPHGSARVATTVSAVVGSAVLRVEIPIVAANVAMTAGVTTMIVIAAVGGVRARPRAATTLTRAATAMTRVMTVRVRTATATTARVPLASATTARAATTAMIVRVPTIAMMSVVGTVMTATTAAPSVIGPATSAVAIATTATRARTIAGATVTTAPARGIDARTATSGLPTTRRRTGPTPALPCRVTRCSTA